MDNDYGVFCVPVNYLRISRRSFEFRALNMLATIFLDYQVRGPYDVIHQL